MGSISTYVESNELLPIILEKRAKFNPNGVWARFPISSSSYAKGFRSATHLELLNAVNKLAWLLEETLGKSKTFETIAYLGPNDLRCSIVVLAGIKCGYKTFLPSPRNSKLAQHSLLTRLNCKVLLTTSPELPCVSMIVEDYPLKKLQIPSLGELLSANVPSYPYTATYEEAKNDPIFVLHTSGSTGIPKPLVYTHMFNTCVANVTSLPMKEGFVNMNTNFQSGAFFSVFPSFHIAGIGFSLIIPTFYGCIPVYPLPSAPPSTDGFLEALKHTAVDWAFLPPIFIDELGKSTASLEFVASKIKYLYFTGGAVPSASGDIVSAKLPLHQVMGSSECAMFPLIREENEVSTTNWSYIQVHPASNPEFRHRFGDLHELIIVRKPEHEKYQAIFTHFPHLQEYETRDLFSPHPTKPGFWKHRSRIDDVIVFLNGEKTNPVSFEHEVSSHPEVKSALVIGHQRFEASLLVELVKDGQLSSEEKEAMKESIWPSVQYANTQCPAHARVTKAMILLADPALPFLRAPKGTIQRQATLNLYEKAIDVLYLANQSDELDTQIYDLKISNQSSVIEVVRELVKRVTDWEQFADAADFFSLGMDSLQILHLRRGLISTLEDPSITTGFIYANPSVELLTRAITATGLGDEMSAVDAENTRLANISATLHKYEQEIDTFAETKLERVTSDNALTVHKEVIILTGSTGAIGSFMLNTLLQSDSVSRIYCLNRSTDSFSIQNSRNIERGIPTGFPSSQVVFLAADLTKSDFGLERAAFDEMVSSTTRIIHNAWPVDFNKTLQSFQSSLDGVLALIKFAANAKCSPSLFFISSISSVGNYQNTKGSLPSIPETILLDPSTPAPMGYGESKYLAERILDYATQKLHISTAAARVGQVAGTAENPRGWNRQEWFPSLVLSSKFLDAVPETLGLGGSDDEGIDWVPIDQLVGVLTGLALGLDRQADVEGIKIFHPVHPHPVSWRALLQTVTESLALGNSTVKTVPYHEWVTLLRESSELESEGSTKEMLHKNPGVKLLDFYESLLDEEGLGKSLKMETAQTLQSSGLLRDLKPIQKDWLQGWIKGWVGS